jgi:hypothetical protein
MADVNCEWLQGFATEYLVESVQAFKSELLRRGLDECGLPMPILGGLQARDIRPSERERARRLIDDHLSLLTVPRRPHHDCACPHTSNFHLPGCIVAEQIRDAARQDVELEREYVETLAKREKVLAIKVRGSVEVES